LLILSLLAVLATGSALADAAPAARHRVVVFVWDGLRPDSISSEDTPTLAVFRARGVDFASHHSVYPTLTMTNAAALATGDYPERHGFYGNTIWAPEASGRNSQGLTVDFRQPVFTEEFGIIDSLDASAHGRLLATPTLIEQATAAGLRAAVIGKSGPVYLQDRTRRGLIVDEKAVFPFELARSLAAAGFALPALTGDAYPAGSPALPLHATAPRSGVVARLADDRTPDPSLGVVSPYTPVNEYLMRVLLDYLWPQRSPDLTIIWLRDPDTTEHAYGPGSTAYRDALRDMDRHFAELLDRLDSLHWRESTDVLVLSDHGHSTVSGDLTRYPLHGLRDRQIGGIDANGYSVSGAVRTADILAHAGVLAFDGFGVLCMAAPMDAPAAAPPSAVNAGIVANTPCRAPTNRLSVAHRVPGDWPVGQHAVVVAPQARGRPAERRRVRTDLRRRAALRRPAGDTATVRCASRQ
jgi:hypothetical protein